MFLPLQILEILGSMHEHPSFWKLSGLVFFSDIIISIIKTLAHLSEVGFMSLLFYSTICNWPSVTSQLRGKMAGLLPPENTNGYYGYQPVKKSMIPCTYVLRSVLVRFVSKVDGPTWICANLDQN